MALTNADLMSLLGGSKQEQPKDILVLTDGELVWTNDPYDLGEFKGKQAPKVRSRKGAVRPGKGGNRDYIPGGEWWDETSPKVVAYRA